jgi:hypothetical protein
VSEPPVNGVDEADDYGIDDDKVCVVAASSAWPFYRLTGAYVCQENRYFQEDTGRLGFYTARLVQGAAPRILSTFPSVELTDSFAATASLDTDPVLRRLGEVVDACLEHGWSDPAVQVILLSPMDDPDTETFEPIPHEGKTAWTMKQRYTRLPQLRTARTTEDLLTESGKGA